MCSILKYKYNFLDFTQAMDRDREELFKAVLLRCI